MSQEKPGNSSEASLGLAFRENREWVHEASGGWKKGPTTRKPKLKPDLEESKKVIGIGRNTGDSG